MPVWKRSWKVTRGVWERSSYTHDHCRPGAQRKQKEILEHTARTCPVLLSLSGEMVKELDLSFEAAAAID